MFKLQSAVDEKKTSLAQWTVDVTIAIELFITKCNRCSNKTKFHFDCIAIFLRRLYYTLTNEFKCMANAMRTDGKFSIKKWIYLMEGMVQQTAVPKLHSQK